MHTIPRWTTRASFTHISFPLVYCLSCTHVHLGGNTLQAGFTFPAPLPLLQLISNYHFSNRAERVHTIGWGCFWWINASNRYLGYFQLAEEWGRISVQLARLKRNLNSDRASALLDPSTDRWKIWVKFQLLFTPAIHCQAEPNWNHFCENCKRPPKRTFYPNFSAISQWSQISCHLSFSKTRIPPLTGLKSLLNIGCISYSGPISI